jgi:hypothetical protein
MAWKNQAETKRLVALLKEMVLEHQEEWLNRRYEVPTTHEWVTINAAALATAQTLARIADMIESIGEKQGGEQVGADGNG